MPVSNLHRFVLSLSHNDPEVVRQGLIDFVDQVMVEHHHSCSFGYYGRQLVRRTAGDDDMQPQSSSDDDADQDLLAYSSFIHPSPPNKLVGILHEYLEKSPHVEELFVLWTLPGRDVNKPLCAAHMKCMALIIHCLGGRSSSGVTVVSGPASPDAIVSRILSDHMKSIQTQLTSNNTDLTHATLGVLLAMMRSSPQSCRDTFQKLNLSSQTLDCIVQKGKTIKWTDREASITALTDARLLVVLMLLLVLEVIDGVSIGELFAERSLVRKVMHAVGRDSSDLVQIVCGGLLFVMHKNPVLHMHIHEIVDGATVKQLLLLYEQSDLLIRTTVHRFLLRLVNTMRALHHHSSSSSSSSSNKRVARAVGSSAVQISVSRCAAVVVQGLHPHFDSAQDEVVMSILSWQPHLLSKCLERVSSEVQQSWEPVQASTTYCAVVAYTIRLLDTVSIDSKTRNSLRGMSAGSSRTGESSSDPQHTQHTSSSSSSSSSMVDSTKRPVVHESGGVVVVTTMLQSWLPRGLTKKDIGKMVFHADAQLQALGLQLLHALLQRVARAVAESGLQLRSHPWLELSVNACLQNIVPDFQSIAGLRSKLLRLKQRHHSSDLLPIDNDDNDDDDDGGGGGGAGGGGKGSCELVGLGAVEDDFDFNVEEPVQTRATTAVTAVTVTGVTAVEEEVAPSNHHLPTAPECLYELLLQVVEDYIAVCPQSVTQSRFDVVRLLDDYLPWELGVSVSEAQQSVAMRLDSKVLLCILRIFRQSLQQAQAEVRWFGGREDSVKTIINIIVAEDWRHAMKRSVLMKLMLLALPVASPRLGEGDRCDAVVALQEEVAHKARSLLKSVLIQSGLFAGHGVVDAELSLELEAWMQTLSTADDDDDDDDSVFVLDILLRLSFHWNSSLAIHDEQREVEDSEVEVKSSSSSRGPLLYSPVLYCAALLAHTNFHLFASDLPKYIRDHISSSSSSISSSISSSSSSSSISSSSSSCGGFFFDKYRSACRPQMEASLLKVFVRVLGSTADPIRYCADMLAAPCCEETASRGDGRFYQTVQSCRQLMSVLALRCSDNSSAVDPVSWSLIAGCSKQTSLSIAFMKGIKSCISTVGSRKKTLLHDADVATAAHVEADGLLDDANFPFSCSLVLSNWEAVQRIVCSIDAAPSAITATGGGGLRGGAREMAFKDQLISFMCTHWRVLLLLQLQGEKKKKGSAMLLSADYVRWITARWSEEYSYSYHQKLGTHMKSLLVLFVVNVMKALSHFIGEHDLTVVTTATAGGGKGDVLLQVSAEGRAPFASLMAPFCQAIVRSASSSSWTSNVSMIAQLCAPDYELAVRRDWLGQVYRLLLMGTSSIIIRRMRQAAVNMQSDDTTGRIARLHLHRDHRDKHSSSSPSSLDSKVAEWWQNIAGLLVAGGEDSQVFSGAMGSDLLGLARTVIQIVDSPQLYKMVVNRTTTTTMTTAVGDDDDNDLLSSLAIQLPHKMMQRKALRHRHPVVVAVGGIIEDTLRSLLPRTMVSSICAAINSGSLAKQSGVSSSSSPDSSPTVLSALSVVTFKVDHHSSSSSSSSSFEIEYFMDPAAFMSFHSTASQYSSLSPRQFLSLRWDSFRMRNSFVFIQDEPTPIPKQQQEHSPIPIAMQLVHILATQVHLPQSLLRSDDPSAALALSELLMTPQLQQQVGVSNDDAVAMIAAEGPALFASIVVGAASPRALFDRCFSLVQLISEALQCSHLLVNFLAYCVQSRRGRVHHDGPSMEDDGDDDDALDLARADDYPVVVILATKLAIERAMRSIDDDDVAAPPPPPLSASIDLWCASYLTATSYLLDRGIACLQLVDHAASVLSSSSTQELKRILSMLSMMLHLSSESSVSAAIRTALPTREAAALKKKLNKFMRTAVKCGIEHEFVLTWLSNMMVALYSSDNSAYAERTTRRRRRRKGSSSVVLLQYVLLPGASDFYSPSTLLKLLPMHSKFESLLLLATATAAIPLEGDGSLQRTSTVAHRTKHALLQLVLVLLLVVVERGELACLHDPDEEQYHLANAVMCSYAATLSESDRLSLRILTILADHHQCPPLCCLVPRMSLHIHTQMGGLDGPPRQRSPQEQLDASSRWVLQEGIINPKVVYSSLTRFPVWRSLRPQAYQWERSFRQQSSSSSSSDTIKSSVAFSSAKCSDAWRHGCAGEEDSYSHSYNNKTDIDGGIDGFEDIESVDGASEEHDEALPKWDPCLHYSHSSLDPSFLMPLLLFVLRNREVSVRQLANSGALSIIIASLGSACSAMRTYALACLHHVDAMIHRQTPTKDPAFRERSQLTLLLSYIKNAVDPTGDDHHRDHNDDTAGTALRLPVTTAIFLGRAAMNVMQPGHELYGKVNKFLLARPCCDVKDVPLFDLLMVNGDNQSDQSQRLAALRLFRDGLLTRRDHLNFCRKNAYSRLMMLFPLIAKDTRAGHAVLDLLDRALCMKGSARYLLERCQLAAWIKLHASPMSAMQLPARHFSGTTSSSSSATAISTEQKSHYSKYLVRSLTILRRIVASSYLLAAEDSVQVIEGLHLIVISTIQDACTAITCGYHDAIPIEYFQQLLLCMWDLQMCAAAAAALGRRMSSSSLWDVDLLYDLYDSMQSKLSALNVSNASSSALEEHYDLLFSLSGLLLHAPSVGVEETSKLDRVASLLHRLTSLLVKHILQHAASSSTSEQSSSSSSSSSSVRRVHAATAYGIIPPMAIEQQLSPSIAQCTIDSTLRTDSTVRVDGNYANLCECMFPPVMGAATDAQPSGQFEYAWAVLSTIDLTCLNCLPASGPPSSDKSFAVLMVVKVLSSYWHAVSSAYFLDNCCDELAMMRWCLLVRTMFLRHSNDDGCIRRAGTQEALLNESHRAPLMAGSSTISAVRLSEVLCKLWLRITAPERRTYYHAVLSKAMHFASYDEPLMAAAAVLKDLQSPLSTDGSTRDDASPSPAAVDQLTSHVFDWFSLLVSAVDNNCMHVKEEKECEEEEEDEEDEDEGSVHSVDLNELLGRRSALIRDCAISLRNELTGGAPPPPPPHTPSLSTSPSHLPSDMEVFVAGVISDLDDAVSRGQRGGAFSHSLDSCIGLTYMPHRDYRYSAKRRKESTHMLSGGPGPSTASSAAVIAVTDTSSIASSTGQTEQLLLVLPLLDSRDDATSTVVVGKRKLSSIGRRFVRSKRL